ncbi:MAG: arginase family protein [Bryobacteraceae bacterium]
MARLGPFRIIEAPFNMGLEGAGVGKGPRHLVNAGADQALSYRGMPAEVQHVRLWNFNSRDLDAVVDVNRQIRAAVQQACGDQVVPVVLAGNCNSAIGTLAGMEPALTGVVWLDAHPDFHTPETSLSGRLEGMSLAVAAGHCHDDLRARSGLSQPIDVRNICLPACFDVEPGERERVAEAGLGQEFPEGVEAVYLHLDIDFLDIRQPKGMPLERACQLVRSIAAELPVAAVGLTNFNPDVEGADERTVAAISLLKQLARD